MQKNKYESSKSVERSSKYSRIKPSFDKLVELMDLHDSFNLVPDRWSKSGWKYVPGDPGQMKYFNSPNRVNQFGCSPARDSGFKERPQKDNDATYRRVLDECLPKIINDAVA